MVGKYNAASANTPETRKRIELRRSVNNNNNLSSEHIRCTTPD
jgi:hypothetical protein